MIVVGDLSTHRCKGDGFTETFTVSFFGHRQIRDVFAIEEILEQQIRDLLRSHEYVEFLVGRDGEFDRLVSSTVKRCKRAYGSHNSALVLVLPYLRSEYRDNERSFHDYYDEVEVCGESANAHFKSAFQIRNWHMIDRSHLVIFCVDHKSGGAYQSLQYTQKAGVSYVNLCSILNAKEDTI